jgi:transposase
VLTDLLGRPAVIRLTAGNVSDVRAADDLLAVVGPLRRLIADKGYDANALRKRLRADGVKPIIPGRINRKRTIRYHEKRYKDRWRIEAAFCRLKDFRRVATRYDKLAVNFLSAVALATIIAFWV